MRNAHDARCACEQSIRSVERVGAPMTTIQAVFLGMMLTWTPSLVLVAFLFWRDEIVVQKVGADLEFDDQPPYRNAQ
jgi:hypothetical protein